MDRIETERTSLRQFQNDDLDSLVKVLGNPEVMRFSRGGPHTREQCKEFIDRCCSAYQSRGYGLFAVVERESGALIGYCGLHDQVIEETEEVEIGYRLHPGVWNQGLGTEAARAVRELGFQTFGFRRMISIIDPKNLASIRVAEKIGMSREKEVILEGYDHPDYVYAIERFQKLPF